MQIGIEEHKPVDTGVLGGVSIPAPEVLKTMHKGQYILHAHKGKLTKVPVEKNLLPHDPKVNPQGVQAALAPDGTVYVTQATIICKSTDGGRTWTSYPRGHGMDGFFQILSDGTFIGITGGGKANEPVAVMSSTDEGGAWRQISQIKPPPLPAYLSIGPVMGVCWILRLPDDILVCAAGAANHVFESVGGTLKLVSGGGRLLTFRSQDLGKTWQNPATVTDWGSEGGAAQTASGKLLAVIRYQRPTLTSDPADLEKQTGSISPGWPYKHVFLADSLDQGHNWQNFRQLTTVFGQTRGYPAALSDGTVVVIHDTRYGPGSAGSRAMISRDEGKTWEDEVYYMDYTTFTGSYNASVVFADDTILTITASSQAGNSWEAVIDHTDMTAIRWKPVKK